HDFLLGRLNMAAYLRRELMLTGDNTLFAKWPAALIAKYAQDAQGNPVVVGPQTPKKSYFLPIVPMPDDNFGVVAPVWPQGKFDPTTLEAPLETRAAAVLGSLRSDNLPGLGGWFVYILGLAGLADTIAKKLVTNLTATFVN